MLLFFNKLILLKKKKKRLYSSSRWKGIFCNQEQFFLICDSGWSRNPVGGISWIKKISKSQAFLDLQLSKASQAIEAGVLLTHSPLLHFSLSQARAKMTKTPWLLLLPLLFFLASAAVTQSKSPPNLHCLKKNTCISMYICMIIV